MANFTPTPLTTLANEAAAVSRINNNLTDIADAIESKLSRDGELPNQMEADLDMNSNDILNVGEIYFNNGTILGGNNPWPSVEDFGAVGNGVADDTAAFRAAAATGRIAEIRAGATYLLSGGITMTSGSGFICPDGMATVVLKTGSGGFNITAQAGDRLNIDRCVFSCSSTEGVTLAGIAMRPDAVNARVIYPVRVSGGCATTPARISRMRFSGFHIGSMVSVNSVGAAAYIIDDIFAVNCGTSLGIAQWGAGVGQWTLFETDNDLVGGEHSQPGLVTRVGCRNCLHTSTALTDFGQQTDCINIAGISGGVDRKGPLIVGVYVDGVGEGIDIFGSGTVVRGMRLRNCHVYGVKLTHGASSNSIEADLIENSGSAAVVLFGSSVTSAATTNNTIRVGVIRNVGQGASFSTGSAVLFGGGTLSQATLNTVTVDAVLEQNAKMTTVVQDGTASSNNGNLVKIGKATGWTAYCSAPPANVRVRSEDSTRVRLTMSANQTLTTAVQATVAFNTVQVDTLGEAITGSNVVRCKTPGAKLVTAKVRISGQNALDDLFLAVQLNGVNVARLDGEAPSGALEQSYDISKIIYIGEDIAGTSAADIRIVATHTGAATATILNTATMSDFEVIDLA